MFNRRMSWRLCSAMGAAIAVGACASADAPDPEEVGVAQSALQQQPQNPVIMRDVHLMTQDPADPTRHQFLDPKLPTFRTSSDGRVAMTLGHPNGKIEFRLIAPERLSAHVLDSGPGVHIVAPGNPATDYVPVGLFRTRQGAKDHHAICERSNNPRACGDKDCYDLTIISATAFTETVNNVEEPRLQLFGKDITVYVSMPKSPDAAIAWIDTSGPLVPGPVFNHGNEIFEPMVTADGHLYVARLTDAVVNLDNITEHTNIVYAVHSKDGGTSPCDVNGWQTFHRVSHAYNDPDMQGRYGIADRPLRDTEGTKIPDGRDLRATYPWIDRAGNNLFFTAVHSTLHYFTPNGLATRYPSTCFNPASCTEVVNEGDLSAEAGDAREFHTETRGLVVAGRWTQGKMVLLDNMLNNVDYGIRRGDEYHRNLSLYQPGSGPGGLNGEVRVGTARDDSQDQQPVDDTQNTTFVDSFEHLFNYDPNMRPRTPRDVVWSVNMGKASEEVAFDDYLDENALIVSEMSASLSYDGYSGEPDAQLRKRQRHNDGFVYTTMKRGTGFGAEPRVQNASTSTTLAPPSYGRLRGGARIEPVALGGIRGKGVWLDGSDDFIEYDLKQSYPESTTWYVGMFVDPRSTAQRVLFRTPSGVNVILGSSALTIVSESGVTVSTQIPQGMVPTQAWSHIGVVFAPDKTQLYVNGYPLMEWSIAFPSVMGPGFVTVGKGTGSANFLGWIDDFKVLAKPRGPEIYCNHARGTLYRVGQNAPQPVKDVAAMYPAASHAAIDAASQAPIPSHYVCFRDYTSDRIPTPYQDMWPVRDAVLGIPALHWNVARGSTTGNTFCQSCHASTTVASLSLLALKAGSVWEVDDPRRQPMQPPRSVNGHIPTNWFAQGVPNQLILGQPQLDKWVYP